MIFRKNSSKKGLLFKKALQENLSIKHLKKLEEGIRQEFNVYIG